MPLVGPDLSPVRMAVRDILALLPAPCERRLMIRRTLARGAPPTHDAIPSATIHPDRP
jgi:hypothetical protein